MARDGKKAIVKVLDFGLAKVTRNSDTHKLVGRSNRPRRIKSRSREAV